MRVLLPAAFLGLTTSLRRKSKSEADSLQDFSRCGVQGGSGGAALAQISNGDDAEECAWRWQAQLFMYTSNYTDFVCGGTLIAPEWVLTTAHCIKTQGQYLMKKEYRSPLIPSVVDHVVLGTTTNAKWVAPSGAAQVRKVVAEYLHPNFTFVEQVRKRPTSRNDFALLRLERPVDVGSCVGPVCLPSADSEDVAPGTECFATGFGIKSHYDYLKEVRTLQEGKVKIQSKRECTGWTGHNSNDIDDATMICAQGGGGLFGGPKVNVCHYDNGGPLVCPSGGGQWTLYGVTSWTHDCESGAPGVFARVHSELDWIRKTMASAPAKAPARPVCPDGFFGPDKFGMCHCPFEANGEQLKCYKGDTPGCPYDPAYSTHPSQIAYRVDCTDCHCLPE